MLSLPRPPRWSSSLLTAAVVCVLALASAGSASTAPFRVLLVGPGLPWSYGPYQQQLGFLATGLAARGHALYWFPAGLRHAPGRPHLGPSEAARATGATEPDALDELRFAAVRFVGSDGPDWHASSLNEVARRHGIDAVVVLKDVDGLVPDVPLTVPVSVYWFPNHFQRLDPMTRVSLSAFTHVAALSPSDARMIAADAKVSPRLDVRHIPHVVSLPDGLPELPAVPKEELRAHFGVPADAFVVVVNSGNYELENRKSFDTSLLAFAALRKTVPSAFLYLHVVDSLGIIRASNGGREPEGLPSGVPLDAMLYHADLPADSYAWDDRVLPYAEVLRLVRMADVLLQPSKTEGFGMPVLEAQLLGTPAITTRDGAMGDFTKYGVAVPPLPQPAWMSRGFVALPDLQGVVDALQAVHRGLPDAARVAAQSWMQKEMSAEAVVDQFEALITEGLRTRPPTPQLSGGEAGPKPNIFHTPQSDGSSPLDDATVLFYEDWDATPWTAPDTEFLLLLSNRYTLDEDNLRRAFAQDPAGAQDVLFLAARGADGVEFPVMEDLSAGRIDRNVVLRLRTRCLVRAIADASAARPLPDLVMATLGAAKMYHYQMSMAPTGVVAEEQQANGTIAAQLVHNI